MNLRQYFGSLWRTVKKGGPRKPRPRRPRPLTLEQLEDRAVPTVLVDPAYGVETQKQDGDAKLKSAHVYLTYWGPYWQSTTSSQAQQIRNAAAAVLGSSYLSGIKQYGSDGKAFLDSKVGYDSGKPPDNFSVSNFHQVIENQIDNGPLPESDSFASKDDEFNGIGIYVVVTQPGILSAAPNLAGYNNKDTDTDVGVAFVDSDNIPEVWVSAPTNADGSLDLNRFTKYFGHEIAEVMTDFGGGGFKVNTPAAWANAGGGGDDQIGDKEGNSYTYRLANGTQVQPYWSRADNAWLLTDGNAQTVNVAAAANAWTNTSTGPSFNGQYDVTVDGDQLPGNPNDVIQVGTASAGGVSVLQINLNGELFQFDAGTVANLTINTGGGSDTVNVGPVPGKVNITIRAGAPGMSSSTTVLAKAPVTISQGPASDLTITAQAAVTVNGLQGSITIANQSTTTINATSANSVFVTQNSGGGGNTNLYIKNAGAVNVGAGNIGTVTSDIDVSNTSGLTALAVDDSKGGAARTYYVNASNVSPFGLGTIYYHPGEGLGSLAVWGGGGGNTLFVNDTPTNRSGAAPVTLNTGSGADSTTVLGNSGPLTVNGQGGADTVYVGDAGRLTNIRGSVTISNPPSFTAVYVDDSADPGARTVTLDTFTSVFLGGVEYGRVSFGVVPIQYKDADTKAMTLYTGTGANTINVLATGAPTNVVTGTGFNQVTVGSAAGGLDGLNGTVSLSGSGYYLTVDDSHTGANRSYTFDRNFVQRSDKARINYTGAYQLTFNAHSSATSTNHFTVQDTMPSSGFGGLTTINNVGGYDSVLVQGTTSALYLGAGGYSFIGVGPNLSKIQGAVNISPSGNAVTLSLEDNASTAPRQLDVQGSASGFGATFQASGAALIQTLWSQVGLFQWVGGSGGNTIRVHGKPAGASHFVLGAGNDSLFLSADQTGNKISNLGSMSVSSGGGSDSVFLNDSDETAARNYGVALDINSRETFSTFGTTVTLGGDGRPDPTLVLVGSGSGNNLLLGPQTTATWRVTGSNAGSLTFAPGTTTFTAVQNLTARSASNTFLFSDGAGVDGDLDGEGRGSVLDYSAYTTGVTVDLSANTATGVGGSVENIQQVRGGAGDDSLTGNATGTTIFLASPGNDTVTAMGGTNTLIGTNVDSTWNLTGSNAGTLTFAGGTTTFTGVQNLTGGTGADRFVFGDGAGVDGTIDGGAGAGINTLDYTAYTTPVAVDTFGSAPGVGAFQNIQNFVGGGGGGNTLTGRTFFSANTWKITGLNAGTLSSAGTPLTFSGFQNLTGRSGTLSTFIFSDGAGVDGVIDGGSTSVNALVYSAYTTPVTVNLSSNSATGVGGGFRNIKTFVGGAGGTNTLVGPDTATTWALTGGNAGTLTGGVSFTAFQNLTGGAGDDTFSFGSGAGVDGKIDGGGGTNTLDYFSYGGNVVVNLQTATASGVGGGIDNIQNLTGTSAGGYNILVGNGNNVLIGARGRRNLLIAGGAASTLVGGNDQDILIAGTTDYDTNGAALLDIMSVWTGADTYADRVARLVDDPTYTYSLNAGTVHSNGGGNTLTGKPRASTALDLYFANLDAGDVTDATASDRLVGIA